MGLLVNTATAQLLISEWDSDTVGVDQLEFVELISNGPNQSLDGFLLVFFNGNSKATTANRSYLIVDLSGLTTDSSGVVLIGNQQLIPAPDRIIADHSIQNGPDAIAVYRASLSDYPMNSLASQKGLIDAVAYDKGNLSASELMRLLGVKASYSENLHGKREWHSIQRISRSNYRVGLPSPGKINAEANLEVQVEDRFSKYSNEAVQELWGSPLQPTYGRVLSRASSDYYQELQGLAGTALKQALTQLVANANRVRKYTYGDVIDLLQRADQNPENPDEVWLLYTEEGRSKSDFQTTSNSQGKWNREHIFPQSRGRFSNGTPRYSRGRHRWEETNSQDLLAGHSDAHHIRAADGSENNRRANKSYGLSGYNGPKGHAGSWRGDVARALFYMAVRYDALELVNGDLPIDTPYKMGDLETLLLWHSQDPPDDFEMNRNNVIEQWQQNRNPFIDLPELATYLWGERKGFAWEH